MKLSEKTVKEFVKRAEEGLSLEYPSSVQP